MKEEFVTYEIALALKDLWFDEECFMWYEDDTIGLIRDYTRNSIEWFNDNCASAPLYQQAFEWFRTHHGIYCGFIEPQTMKIRWAVNNFQIIEGDTNKDTQQKCLVEMIKRLKDAN